MAPTDWKTSNSPLTGDTIAWGVATRLMRIGLPLTVTELLLTRTDRYWRV